MQRFIGTKVLMAVAMALGAYNEKRGWKIPENEDPEREGYFVEYEDGYQSWSPKEVFEKAYREYDALPFGHAVEAAKLGKRIARSGWNGSGMYAYIVPANTYPALTDVAKKEFGEFVPYRAYFALKTAQNDVATWAPSGSDCLAEDWYIVE